MTNIKRGVLDQEYNNLQHYLATGENLGLYSANKQQADRFYKKIKAKNYPLSIRNDLLKIEKQATQIAEYWARLPMKGRKGGLWVALKPHCSFPPTFKIRESKLVLRNGNYILNICVEVETPKIYQAQSILAIDLGERVIATSVALVDDAYISPKFYGRSVRGIRRHYSWLRKRLQEKSLREVVRRVGNTEKRKVKDQLHKISRQIVDEARELKAVIVIGDLKDIRNSAKGKGRRFNRIVGNMPYFTLTQMIAYKAEWVGVPLVKINERGTSHTCHKCGSAGKRPKQGLFVCGTCGQYNADLNGAKNIAKRGLQAICSEMGLRGSALNSNLIGEAPRIQA